MNLPLPTPHSPLPITLLIRNLSQVATPLGRTVLRGRAMRELAVYENAIIVIRDGRFAFVGRESEISTDLRASIDDDFNARGATAVPGFIDSHTHIPFAGYRETEFNR